MLVPLFGPRRIGAVPVGGLWVLLDWAARLEANVRGGKSFVSESFEPQKVSSSKG